MLALFNPDPTDHQVTVRLLPEAGSIVERTVTVPARRPVTVVLTSWLGGTASVMFGLEVIWPPAARGVASLWMGNQYGTAVLTQPVPLVACVTP